MALIRSVTIFIDVGSEFGGRGVAELANDLVADVREFIRRVGLNVWSVRVALPPTLPHKDQVTISEMLCNEGVLIASYHVDAEGADINNIAEAINSCQRSYVTIRMSGAGSIPPTADILTNLHKLIDVKDFSRIGISIPDYIQTPYFPLATAFKGGIAVALRYVDLIKEAVARGDLGNVISFIHQIKTYFSSPSELRLKFLGIDYSISPWEDESVVEVAEMLTGVKFALPGSGWAVMKLNNMIKEVADIANVRALGFNEVMLPVAEDNLLKERVAEGYVTLRDLTYLTAYCLVGVDMVVMRRDPSIIKGVLRDVYSSATLKGKVVGVRVIPVDGEEGDLVDLGRFGKVPVIKY